MYTHNKFLESVYVIIHCLKNQDELNSAREQLFKKIYELMLEKGNMGVWTHGLCSFVRKYADYVFVSKESFDEKFFSDAVDFCVEGRATLLQFRLLITSTAIVVCISFIYF